MKERKATAKVDKVQLRNNSSAMLMKQKIQEMGEVKSLFQKQERNLGS
jgi:hypothetical protein